MGIRARWLKLALGTTCVTVAVALTGCGASALPPAPPPGALLTATASANIAAAPTTSVPSATRVPTSGTSSSSPALLAQGKAAFNSSGCGGCHMLTAAGSAGISGPSLNGIGSQHDAVWIVAQIKNPCAAGHANAAGPKYICQAMPAGLASGATAQALAAYLAAQK